MILVTGISSSPGFKIGLKLSEKYDVLGVYNEHKIEGINSVKYDLSKEPEKLLFNYKPEILVHVAAIGNVDFCEENKKQCYKINVEITRRLFNEAYKRNIKIVYVSTDYVFDGKKGLYKEDDIPSPINYYGLTKLIGEEIALANGGTVIRIAAVYGMGYGRTNFGKFIIEKLSKNEKIEAAVDQYLSPTLNTQIGEAIVKLIEKDFNGLIHITGPRLSRFEFAIKAAEKFGFDKSLVNPVSIEKFTFKAPRPRDSSLDNSLGIDITGIELNNIDKSLDTFRSEYYAI
ncbi:MAG: SDR family oxidoreductase [Thermoplasmata archaeon]|jgi:dTDP-4-dehydrorhamnose reductase